MTVQLRAEIKADKLKKPSSLPAKTQAKPQSTLRAGTLVPQKTALTPTEKLAENRAKAMAQGPLDEAAEYAEKAAANYFDDAYFHSGLGDEAAYADDVISEVYESLGGPVASISSSVKTAAASRGASTASAVATGSTSATRASATLSSLVSKGGKNAHLNLKTAAAASALGLAGGYVTNRKRTRR